MAGQTAPLGKERQTWRIRSTFAGDVEENMEQMCVYLKMNNVTNANKWVTLAIVVRRLNDGDRDSLKRNVTK